ncbi:hypothetical protein BJV82DRAFT_400684 [Fennellomyces sp. T-0311]|nr:hypothetical protein BJV82DRAFT_400684 [Fennellomyces sp. T-0311]
MDDCCWVQLFMRDQVSYSLDLGSLFHLLASSFFLSRSCHLIYLVLNGSAVFIDAAYIFRFAWASCLMGCLLLR